MEPPVKEKTEIDKLRLRQNEFQLRYPELFRSDSSIFPSYTNLKLPYSVICRQRKNRYLADQEGQRRLETQDIAMRQVRAWDGVRVDRILGSRPPSVRVLNGVPANLTPKERQRLDTIMNS